MNTSNQLAFDFNVHRRENNPESQKCLDAGRKSFSGKCRILFDAFMQGNIINTLNSPVSDFRRRKLDLQYNNGIKISLYSVDGHLKNWHMTQEDRQHNAAIISG